MRSNRVLLGVNIDHVATLRQVRGTDYPDPVAAAQLCETAGAHGITVHLREDRRHIQDADVFALKKALRIPLNLEMACEKDILEVALRVCPAEACLVPERRAELTTEGGLDVAGRFEAVRATVAALGAAGIAASLFVDPDPIQIQASAETGAPLIELHTGRYCNGVGKAQTDELRRLCAAAGQAHALGLKVNAGHGIHLDNVAGIMSIPYLHTLNIGHSIVARAVLVGMAQAVREMLEAMAWAS